MCHWGQCAEVDSVRRCKYCGTQFCNACGLGDFANRMQNFERCIVCKMADFEEMVPEPKKLKPKIDPVQMEVQIVRGMVFTPRTLRWDDVNITTILAFRTSSSELCFRYRNCLCFLFWVIWSTGKKNIWLYNLCHEARMSATNTVNVLIQIARGAKCYQEDPVFHKTHSDLEWYQFTRTFSKHESAKSNQKSTRHGEQRQGTAMLKLTSNPRNQCTFKISISWLESALHSRSTQFRVWANWTLRISFRTMETSFTS
ncbi:hypothetical protein CSKR_112452, partial [Clonorchis sinensis]